MEESDWDPLPEEPVDFAAEAERQQDLDAYDILVDDAFDAIEQEFNEFVKNVGARFTYPLEHYRGNEQRIYKAIKAICDAKVRQ